MNPHSNLYTLSYKINSINYYAILLKNNVFLLKNSDGKILDINQKDKDTFKELLDKIQKQKYKFIKYIDYKGQRIKEYLNQLDGLLYFTVEQNGKELACSYNNYPDLYNQANFNMELGDNESLSNNNETYSQWDILREPEPQKGENQEELSPELIESLDNISEKLPTKPSWTKKLQKMFVTLALTATIAVSITYCGNTRQNNIVDTSLNPATIYQINSFNSNDRLEQDTIEDILHDNGFDDSSIRTIIEDYEERLGASQKPNDINHAQAETIADNKTARQALEAINNNEKLSDSDKAFLQETFAPWLSKNATYLDDYCIERLENLKIVYNTEEGSAQKYGASGFTGTLQDDGSVGRYIGVGYIHTSGQDPLKDHYFGIAINNTDPDGIEARATLSHEFIHVLMPNWPEGMVELYNPVKNNNYAYGPQQLAMIMLEEIYGEDTLKKSFSHDDTLSTLANNEAEADLLRNTLYGMSSFGKNGTSLASLFEPLGKLYETTHPGKKASENLVFGLCKDIFNGTNNTNIAQENETISHFLYKNGKLYIACTSIMQNGVNPILEGLGLAETKYASISRLIPVE